MLLKINNNVVEKKQVLWVCRNEGWQTLTLAYTTTHQERTPTVRKENKGLAGHGEE
jgi:hypothetical protein